MRPVLDPTGHRVPRTKPTCLLHTWRPHRQRPFTLVLHLHQHESSRNLHLQYLVMNQSTQRCQSLITPGNDHPLVLEPHMVLKGWVGNFGQRTCTPAAGKLVCRSRWCRAAQRAHKTRAHPWAPPPPSTCPAVFAKEPPPQKTGCVRADAHAAVAAQAWPAILDRAGPTHPYVGSVML
jgi:hypothetical protein